MFEERIKVNTSFWASVERRQEDMSLATWCGTRVQEVGQSLSRLDGRCPKP